MIKMIPILVCALPCGLLLAAPSAQDSAGDGQDEVDVQALYVENCSACHLPPDPNFETDRAWLNQVLDTA